MQRYLVLIFASLFCLTVISAQQVGEELIVAVKPKAIMRSDGNLHSKSIGAIEFGKVVKVVEVAPYPSEVMYAGGRWLKIEYAGKRGWVFGPLLRSKYQQHTIRILNGTIVPDDPAASVPSELKQLLDSLAGAEVKIDFEYVPDSARSCDGTLVFAAKGAVKKCAHRKLHAS